MQTSNKVRPMETLTLDDGTVVRVSSLPETVRYEVETLERFNQRRLDLIQELEIIELAIRAKGAQLNKLAKPTENTEA